MVQAQLHFINAESTWRLDEKTRRVGRQGVAKARAALAASADNTVNAFAPIEAEPIAPVIGDGHALAA